MLLKFQRSGRYYSAIVLAASWQLLLRLAQPGDLSGSLPRLPRTSSVTAGTLTPPDFHNPVEVRSFATCQPFTLPSWFCLTWRTPFATFRFVRGTLPQAPEPTHSAPVAYFVPHFRQPQAGQRYHFREFGIRKLSVFYIIGHYSHPVREGKRRVRWGAYNTILCKIRTAASVRKTPF